MSILFEGVRVAGERLKQEAARLRERRDHTDTGGDGSGAPLATLAVMRAEMTAAAGALAALGEAAEKAEAEAAAAEAESRRFGAWLGRLQVGPAPDFFPICLTSLAARPGPAAQFARVGRVAPSRGAATRDSATRLK